MLFEGGDHFVDSVETTKDVVHSVGHVFLVWNQLGVVGGLVDELGAYGEMVLGVVRQMFAQSFLC